MTSFDPVAVRKMIQAAAEQFGSDADEEPSRARKRARLLEAATALFTRHGYRKTSVHEVARRAGVAKGTLYLYFPTKADLLLAALFEERVRFLDAFLPLLEPDMPGRERLRLWLREIVMSLDQSPLLVRLLGRDREFWMVMEDLDPSYLEQVVDMKTDFLAAMIDDACEPEHRLAPEVLQQRARVLMATFNAAGFFADREQRLGMELESFIDGLCDILIAGVCAPPLRHQTEVSP